ncbi:uncharacterized protein FIESC28_10263 [Fusarium coffeatum]|uniref:Uncharacterized protein n=1 Tax=Fusarium coffeatum TaxID=231269 RepID=A0A366QUA6_9HYPO|nr:uncharacterized protein FIESC28_10263 [Fusarium coffeatum]RBR08463.1 hypothetical protein FIESC28_10263 [Fusarium coffeatum]
MSLSTQRNGQTGFVQLLEQVYERFRTTETSELRPSIIHLFMMLDRQARSRSDHHQYGTAEITFMMMDHVFSQGDVSNVYRDRLSKPESAIGIALMPHCPVSFLATLLSNPLHEGYEFTAENPSWKSSGGGVHLGTYYATTDMRWIVETIYEVYFEPFWGFGDESRAHDFARELEAKVNPLRSIKYTDSTERKVLESLVETVLRVQTEVDKLEQDEAFLDRVHCCENSDEARQVYYESTTSIWFALCCAIAPLADRDYNTQCEERSQEFGPRRHRFVVDPAWDPRAEWLERELDKHIPLCVEAHRTLPKYATPVARIMRDDLKKVYKQVMFNRAGGRAWYEIEDQNEWYVTPQDVRNALESRDIEGAFDGLVEWMAMVGM